MADINPKAALGLKMQRLMRSLRYFKKDETHGIGYKFVSSAAVMAQVNPHLDAAGLAVLSTHMELLSEGKRCASVRLTYTIVDVETGETTTIQGMSGGEDPGDKSISKALTLATKSAWLVASVSSTGSEENLEHDAKRAVDAFIVQAETATEAEAVVSLYREAVPAAEGGGTKYVNRLKNNALRAVTRLGRDLEWMREEVARQASE